MAKTLILVRHGKAQPRTNDRLDEVRELTSAGRRALAAQYPRTFSLPRKRELATAQVWSSSASRARQTAEIIAKVIDAGVPIALQSLLEQDDRAFLVQVAASSADFIVAVGHNPFVERICERLCGSHIAFAPGAACALYLPADMLGHISGSSVFEPAARLQWFVQGPQAKRWQTLVDMEDELARWMSRVEERLAAFLRDPNDVERLHRLRVSIRTLRSLVAFASPYMANRSRKTASEDLRFVVGLTSDQRDRDVLCDQVSAVDPRSDELVAACARERDERRVEVVRKLGGEKVAKRMFRTGRELRNVTWKRCVAREGVDPEELRARLAGMLDEAGARLSDADGLDMEAIHTLRKEAKRVRYVAENLGEAFGLDAAPISAAMEETQNRLGVLCDAHVGIVAIDRFPREGLSEEALQALGALRSRYAETLGIAVDAPAPEMPPSDE